MVMPSSGRAIGVAYSRAALPAFPYTQGMRRDDVIRLIREHKAEIDALGVTSLSLFGSVARDEAGPESDVDVLVEFEGPTRFEPFMDLKFLLEDTFGCQVDLATRGALRRELAPRILKEAVRVA